MRAGPTLEQQRAAEAWRCAQAHVGQKEYVNLAKGLPALIMNSGLLQVMAFLNRKGTSEAQRHCGQQLRDWVCKRFPEMEIPADFPGFMKAVMATDPRTFQMITVECLAWLRWLRQIAPTLTREGR